LAISDTAQTTAISGGNITSDGGGQITVRGVCWSLDSLPLISDSHTSDGTGTGEFISLLSELIPNTTYYVRAYATNESGTAYGNQLIFKTLEELPAETVTDIDGITYIVVKIGTQKWIRENLRVTHYRNGDPIPEIKTDAKWKIQTAGARCTYDNLPANSLTFGNLYNFQAVSDSRGLCPEGWHIPSSGEWDTLSENLGGSILAGGKMKAVGILEQSTGLWYSPNTGATNSSGFSGIPGGYRINYGNFYSINNVAYFWSSTDTTSNNGWNFVLDANNAELTRNFNLHQNGFSVRCVKD
jgi:uncharacterized protein (TIGR02145 family)